jgi:hypothetical protein
VEDLMREGRDFISPAMLHTILLPTQTHKCRRAPQSRAQTPGFKLKRGKLIQSSKFIGWKSSRHKRASSIDAKLLAGINTFLSSLQCSTIFSKLLQTSFLICATSAAAAAAAVTADALFTPPPPPPTPPTTYLPRYFFTLSLPMKTNGRPIIIP